MLIFLGFFSCDVCDISEYRVDFAVALTASAVAGLTHPSLSDVLRLAPSILTERMRAYGPFCMT